MSSLQEVAFLETKNTKVEGVWNNFKKESIPKNLDVSDDEDEALAENVEALAENTEALAEKPKRPELDGMTHEVESNEFLRSLEYKTNDELTTFLSELKTWILNSKRLNKVDFEQYRMVKSCLDGRGIDDAPSRRKLFASWKKLHPEQKVTQYEGLPIFCYDFEASDKKRKFQKMAQKHESQKKYKAERSQTTHDDPLALENINSDNCMWVSFHPEMIQFVAESIGRQLNPMEKKQIEASFNELSSFRYPDGIYYVNMLFDERQVVSQKTVTNFLRKYHGDIVRQFAESSFSTLLGQIPEDDKSLEMRQELLNLYKAEVRKSMGLTLSSVIRQMFDFDNNYRRKNCLAQTMAGLKQLSYLYTLLDGKYVLTESSDDGFSFNTTHWRSNLCKLMKFPMAKIRSFQKPANNPIYKKNASLSGPTLVSTNGGLNPYREAVTKIYNSKDDINQKHSQHRELIEKVGMTVVGGSIVPPRYKSSNQNQSSGQKKLECQKCGRRVVLRGSMMNSHNCTPSKEWLLLKEKRAKAKQMEKEQQERNQQRERNKQQEQKNNNQKNHRHENRLPSWQYRLLTRFREPNSDKPVWKHLKDNSLVNKIVIDDAVKNNYLPSSVTSEPGMVEWLSSGRDDIRIRRCSDKEARYQFFTAYIEDLSIDCQEEERYRPVVIAVSRINGIEGLEIMMDSQEYKSQAHLWKKGELQLVFNPEANQPDVIPGMEYDLNALFVKNRIDPSFGDGSNIMDWIFNSYGGWKYHQKQLTTQKENIEAQMTANQSKKSNSQKSNSQKTNSRYTKNRNNKSK